MAISTTIESLIELWESFFKNYYKTELDGLSLSYPEKRSLIVDYWDVDQYEPELAEFLLSSPNKAFYTAEEALKRIDYPTDKPVHPHLRVKNLPDHAKIGIRNLRSIHLASYVACEGLIKKITEVRPKLQTAAFQCGRCGAIVKISQEERTLTEPVECYEDQGGCGRQTTFKLLTPSSILIDSQKVELQESPEGLRGGAQPERLTIYLEDDIVGEVVPGDRVKINGILMTEIRRSGSMKLTELSKVMFAYSVEQQQQAFDEVVINPEDEEEILRLSRQPDIYDKIVSSIAPSIYGMATEKEALAYQLFGGVAKEMPDGTRVRGDIHILFVGDPGVAKSQLLRYVSRLAPRSIYASGRSSSAAGLTAAAVKDEFGEGRWVLEAGALVLADQGIACIDEMDKMSSQDRSALHEAMEQQEVTVTKAGINASLKTRCALLGAANPKLGRFDEFMPMHEQINMPPALLSRFDLIFSLTDKPDPKFDKMLASHILNSHRAGQIKEIRKKNPGSEYASIDDSALVKAISPEIAPEAFRKYVAYAKRNCFPVMTEEAIEAIMNYYVDLRNRSKDSIPFTARQLEAFVRIAEASAKMRLAPAADMSDARRAIKIVEYYLQKVGMDRETGAFDIDVIATGISHSQQDRMQKITAIIKRLAKESEDGTAQMDDITREAEIDGINRDKTEDAIQQMRKRGTLMEKRTNRFSPV
ncbi:MAG: AAA family ATPase [Thermoplasmata archaeon HGW-Thermoplasmata-1]|nr:MAG: AAA family ATPase [Thermoplasmata archaeon HGW-Thermoplasmata-1]